MPTAPKQTKRLKRTAAQKLRTAKAKLRHAALTHAPMWLTRGKLANTKSLTRIELIEREIALPNLPDALTGLRITHLTDLHVGSIFKPDRLPQVIEKTNAFGGDLIAVTGDFVDLSLSVLDQVTSALKQLTAPLGVYLVPGNHDYLDDGNKLIKTFRDAGLNILVNESVSLTHKDHNILIAGIDYPHTPKQMRTFLTDTLRQSRGRRKADFRLLLSHHPNAFDYAKKHHIDLTLAGHTHGGQIVMTNKRGKKGSIGLGNIAHRYPRGLYQHQHQYRHENEHQHAYLYVNSGVGSWFPLRLNCPAEIACITLTSMPPLA
jgi:uncharacterized protein